MTKNKVMNFNIDPNFVRDNSPERRAARKKHIALLTVKYIVAVILVIFFMFPYVFMLSKSFMTSAETAKSEIVHFFPRQFTFSNYKIVGEFFRSLLNTVIIIAINATFIPLSACFVAYPLARHKFTGKKVMFSIIMGTVMIPSTVVMVSQYTLYSMFHLTDTLASQFIGAFWGGGALNIFLVIQFMRVLPKEMDDAAKIDGANEFQIFGRIIMPLCFNIVILISVNTIIGMWMDFQSPLLYITTPSKYTVGLAFYRYFAKPENAEFPARLMAMSVVMSILPICLFMFFQKSMIGGFKVGGVKG